MTPILHHYPASPFAELVRTAFGLKGLAWQSVIVPNILPKPGQTELTGGYGRTPVVQIGADIHCDTAAIIAAIEALPGPTLYPAPLGPMHRMLAHWWGQAMFFSFVGAAMGGLTPEAMGAAFVADRQARFGFDMSQLGRITPHLAGQAEVAAAWLDGTLADGRAFIGGDMAGHADLAAYADLWFVRNVPTAGAIADRMFAGPHLAAWYDRMAAIGHGRRTEISAEDAIVAAREAAPVAGLGQVDAPFTAGQAVLVKTEGCNDPPVAGRLVRYDRDGITVIRESDRASTVAVHFPRLGQMVLPG